MIDNNTQFFKTQPDKAISVEGILEQVYRALKEKGLQSGESDCGIHYVRRSYLYYKP